VYLCVFVKILSLSLNTVLIVDKDCSDVCCDEFPELQIDRKSKQVKTVTWKILFGARMENNSLFQILKISKFVDE